jgi:hypothetical protein
MFIPIEAENRAVLIANSLFSPPLHRQVQKLVRKIPKIDVIRQTWKGFKESLGQHFQLVANKYRLFGDIVAFAIASQNVRQIDVFHVEKSSESPPVDETFDHVAETACREKSSL